MVKTTVLRRTAGVNGIQQLLETMARLRAPDGCPWDREQTHQSLCETLIEEVCELLETIDKGDMTHMREELGDVLLQVVFHAQMAAEAGHFDFDAVAREINEKLVRRHPHVFGDLDLKDSDAVLANWDRIKVAEKQARGIAPQPDHVLKPLPPALPALLFARDVHKQILKRNLPLPSDLDSERIKNLSVELSEPDAGRMLYEIAAACRLAGIDPESALRRFTRHVIDSIEHAGPPDTTV